MKLDPEKEQWLTEAYPIAFRRVFNTLRRKGLERPLAAEYAADGTQHATLIFLQRQETELGLTQLGGWG